MEANISSKSATYKGIIIGKLSCSAGFVGLLLLMSIGIFGCKGTTINPTEPSNIEPLATHAVPTPAAMGTSTENGTPTPTPIISVTPAPEATGMPVGNGTSTPTIPAVPTPAAMGTPTGNRTPIPTISAVPTPTATEMPIGNETLTPTPTPTPTPTSYASDDSGAETPYDPNIKTLKVDEKPYTIMMYRTGDIRWYKVQIPQNVNTLSISLTDIPVKSDYDLIAYDADLRELKNGRSAHSGNSSERLLLSQVGALIYLQIYSYSGRGEATLTLTGEKTEASGGTGNGITQLTYENILSTYYPMYPRGTRSGSLERSVETIETEEITCQTSNSRLVGELTIGNYAHVGRELLESVDYVDGWTVVVFNGPVSVLDTLRVTIRVTIFAPELNLRVEVPAEMEIDGHDYLVSTTERNVYYLSHTYGNFWGNSSDDIRISSGVVGNVGDLFSNNIFTQQVEVQWQLTASDGSSCSGRAKGKPIVDFEMNKLMFFGKLEGEFP